MTATLQQAYAAFASSRREDLSVKYEITREMLGQGGMCEVYSGRCRETGVPLAFKALKPALKTRTDLTARHIHEIHILRDNPHPHILRFHDEGLHNDQITLVTEQCATSLYKMYQYKPAPIRRVLKYAVGVLEALEVVHTVGVIHRDIKPSNILIGTDGQVRLADFGVAKVPGEVVDRTRKLGTPKYTAPDLREDQNSAAPEHDMYALGLTMYALHTHKNTQTLIESRGTDRGLLLSAFDPAIEAIIHRATHPYRHRRYESAAEMLRDLLAAF